MTPDDRSTLIRRYADGPAVLKAALARVPGQATKWRPAPAKWSVHEILCHTDAQWTKAGTHTEIGRYTGEDWLRICADHLHIHARQIDRNLAAWKARPAGCATLG